VQLVQVDSIGDDDLSIEQLEEIIVGSNKKPFGAAGDKEFEKALAKAQYWQKNYKDAQ